MKKGNKFIIDGGGSSTGGTTACGAVGCGFNSRSSPQKALTIFIYINGPCT